MTKFYFTFGQSHYHKYKGIIFDKDCVIEIIGDSDYCRDKMFSIFCDKWSFQYDKLPDMNFFPRGIIKI